MLRLSGKEEGDLLAERLACLDNLVLPGVPDLIEADVGKVDMANTGNVSRAPGSGKC
jgi:hypothetical protein